MSRSRKKVPIGSIISIGWTEKSDKRRWHQRIRSREGCRLRKMIRTASEAALLEAFDGFLPMKPNDVSNPFFMQKEYRVYWDRRDFLSERAFERWVAK